MSWSVNEGSYPVETTVAEMEKREFNLNYQNRGAYNPQPIHIRVLSNHIMDDAISARQYILDHTVHGESACVKYYAPVTTEGKKSKNYIEKIQKEIESLRDYSEKHTMDKQKAQFVGCKSCGSKLARVHLKPITTCISTYSSFLAVQDENTGYRMSSALNRCPVCGEYLQSDAIINEIKRREGKIIALRDEYRANLKTKPSKVMWYVISRLYIG